MHVLLIGARGSGKTSVGRWLADHLGRAFIDLDDRALASFPEDTIRAVWLKHGESAWREAEFAQLEIVLANDKDVVLALGGGTPIIPAARAKIEEAQQNHRALVVYLRTSTAKMRERLSSDPGDRPSITGQGSIEEIDQVLALREPIYDALADCTCDTDEYTIAQIGCVIAAEMKYHKA